MLGKIVHTYWTRLLATALVFVSVVLTSRYLGADGKGLTSLIATNILFINLVNEMVGGVSLIYLIPRRKPLSLLVPSLLFTLVSSLLITALFHYLLIIPKEYSVHLYAIAVLQTLNNTALYVLLGKEKVKQHNYFFLLKAIINAGFLALFFMVIGEASVDVFVNGLYASNGVPLLISLIFITPYLMENLGFRDIIESFNEMFSYSSMAQLANIVQTLNYRLSFYLLNIFISKGAVGIYSVALALCDVIWMMSKSIGTVQLARISNTTDHAEMHRLTKRVLSLSVMSTFLLLIPALLLPASTYALFFGNDFAQVRPVLLVISPGILIFSVNIILANHFSGTGRYGINLTASVFGLMVNAGANYLLIPRFGLTGAAVAATLTYTVITFYTWLQFIKETSLGWKDLLISREDLRKIATVMGWKENSY